MLVEVTTFRLAPGVDEVAFLRADAEEQEAAMLRTPRALRRTTARGEDGDWLVLVLRDDGPADPLPFPGAWADAASVVTARYRTLD